MTFSAARQNWCLEWGDWRLYVWKRTWFWRPWVARLVSGRTSWYWGAFELERFWWRRGEEGSE